MASLQAELAMMQTQVINSRFAYASAHQSTQQQQLLHQPDFNVAAMQPAYSNNSSASTTNLMNMSNFNPGFDLAMATVPSSHSLEPLQYSQLPQYEEDDEESKTPGVFNNDIGLHH